MNKLPAILNKAKSAVMKNKLSTCLGIVIVLLIFGLIYQYSLLQEAKNESKIQTVIKAKEATAEEVKEWNDKINDHNQEFIETQKNLTNKVKEIRKNTKHSKLPNYEKPNIKNADYNTMLDSLLIAQPD